MSSLDIDNPDIIDKLEYVFCSNGDNIIFKYNNFCVKMVVFGLHSSLETAEMKILNILTRLVVSNRTPHILLPLLYGYSKISLSNLIKDIDTDDNLIDIKKDIKKGLIASKKLLIITEWCDSKDLNSYINDKIGNPKQDKLKNDLNQEKEKYNNVSKNTIDENNTYTYCSLTVLEWKIILFKIIYTLSVILTHYPSFRHNDLSSKNILVNKSECRINKHYKFDYLLYEIPPSDIEIFLWDFEYSNIKDLVNNRLIVDDLKNMKNEYGIRIERNQYYDIHYFLNSLYCLKILPKEIENFILRNVDRKHLGRDIPYNTNNYRLLQNVEYNTPKKMLKDALFREFIVEDKIGISNTCCLGTTGIFKKNNVNKYIGN
jgi:hypothetical protein